MKYEILFKEMKNGRTVIDEITRSVIGAAETRPEMADHECVAEVGLDNAFDGVDDDLPFDEESNGVFESWALHVAQWAVEHVPSENRPVSNRDPRLPPPGTRMQIPGHDVEFEFTETGAVRVHEDEGAMVEFSTIHGAAQHVTGIVTNGWKWLAFAD